MDPLERGECMQATAEATAECTSRVRGGGKARGCAAAEATAYAFEAAFAEAHASASAEAFAKYCSCARADAWAFGDADLFLVLVADAYAEASAAACAEGATLTPPAFSTCSRRLGAELPLTRQYSRAALCTPPKPTRQSGQRECVQGCAPLAEHTPEAVHPNRGTRHKVLHQMLSSVDDNRRTCR